MTKIKIKLINIQRQSKTNKYQKACGITKTKTNIKMTSENIKTHSKDK